MGDRAAVGEIYGHPMPTPSTAGALPVVRRQRWNVSHEYGIELADIDAKLEGRRADEGVDRVRLALE